MKWSHNAKNVKKFSEQIEKNALIARECYFLYKKIVGENIWDSIKKKNVPHANIFRLSILGFVLIVEKNIETCEEKNYTK